MQTLVFWVGVAVHADTRLLGRSGKTPLHSELNDGRNQQIRTELN